MSLIRCPDCGASVSKAAPACPKCGRPWKQKQPAKQYGCCGLLLILGCGGFIAFLFAAVVTGRRPPPDLGPAGVITPQPAVERESLPDPASIGAVALTPADFGGEWPIRAQKLVLNCLPSTNSLSGRPDRLVTAFIDGKTYAVNGSARGRMESSGLEDFDDLCPRDADGTFTIEAIKFRQQLIDRGLALCR